MLTATITVKGDTLEDVGFALDEAKRLISEGFTSGGNRNDTGSFTIDVDGEEATAERAE